MVLDLEGNVAHGMVEQVLAHAGQFLDDRYAELLKLVARAHSRQHQEVGRFQRAGAQHNLIGLDVEYLAAAFGLHAGDASAIEQDPSDEDVALDGEVEAVAHGIQVGDRRAHANAGLVVHGNRADARRVGAVEVGVGGVAAFEGGGVEGFLNVGPRLVLAADDGDGTVAAVEIVLDVEVGLSLAKEGQDFQVSPLLVAEGCPPLEVLGQAAQIDLAVDGTGTADDLALGDVDLALLVVDGAAQRPGDR